jgi:uncharacterized protein
VIDLLKALALGFLFGGLLHKGGLTHYARIVGVYRFKDLGVLEFMLAALAVAAVGIQLQVGLGMAAPLPVPPTHLLANLLGGIVFGIGMATAGYCPGTILAEAGEGRLDALVAGFGGLFVGALIFGAIQPALMPTLAAVGSWGRVTLASLGGVSPGLVALIFAEVVVVVLLLLARARRD